MLLLLDKGVIRICSVGLLNFGHGRQLTPIQQSAIDLINLAPIDTLVGRVSIPDAHAANSVRYGNLTYSVPRSKR